MIFENLQLDDLVKSERLNKIGQITFLNKKYVELDNEFLVYINELDAIRLTENLFEKNQWDKLDNIYTYQYNDGYYLKYDFMLNEFCSFENNIMVFKVSDVKWLHTFQQALRLSGFDEMANTWIV